MKKVFKALSILVATTALSAGIAVAATGCSSGYDGTYTGDYHYVGAHGGTYGMKVKVTVENNIITKVEDVTGDAYTAVSTPWEVYRESIGMSGVEEAPAWYNWTQSNADNWTNHENWLLQQYVGWSVADVLDIDVFTDTGYVEGSTAGTYERVPGTKGEPYATAGGWNAELQSSGLLITGATQGSGRLLLAVQDALSK